MAERYLRVESGALARVILNRPQARNAMGAQALEEIASAFQKLSRDPALRVVLVTGEGPDFCAGADIEWMRAGGRMNPEDGKKDARLFFEMLKAVDECPVPVIVAAQGHVFGGGLGLLAACDIALLADDAKLCFSEVRLGILPAVISCWVLPKIGAANARRWYLSAELFGAREAVAMGLAHEAVSAKELNARAESVAASVLKNGPQAVRAAKAAIHKLSAGSLEERAALAVDALVRLRSSPEGQEGLSAFLDKRAPSWTL